MPDQPEEPTQRTEKGLEIPIPTRDEFFKNLNKAAKAKPPDPDEQDRADDADPD